MPEYGRTVGKKRMATVGDVVISVGNYKCVSKIWDNNNFHCFFTEE